MDNLWLGGWVVFVGEGDKISDDVSDDRRGNRCRVKRGNKQ